MNKTFGIVVVLGILTLFMLCMFSSEKNPSGICVFLYWFAILLPYWIEIKVLCDKIETDDFYKNKYYRLKFQIDELQNKYEKQKDN